MTAHRLIVISDLHIGGTPPSMMSRPNELADFITNVPRLMEQDESLELVIAGDFVDFLAVDPSESWTADPTAARRKLETTMSSPSPFANIFAALRKIITEEHRLTVMVGNHDVEMALPGVQDAFLDTIGASRHQVLFVDDGRAYRIGKVLIEHGNRYDDANNNDWQTLRTIVSAQSRFEKPPEALLVSAGSTIVERVVSPLRPSYPFIDLLQPQGEVLAWLLYAFEPRLIYNIRKIGLTFRGYRRSMRNREGQQPGDARYIAGADDDRDTELAGVYGEAYEDFHNPAEDVGLQEWITILPQRDGLRQLFERQQPLPSERLNQIRTCLRKLLLGDESDRIDGDTQQYGRAAERMIADSDGAVELVIMGHTHMARRVGSPDKASYINTGTWTDIVRVPERALKEGGNRVLEQFLLGLMQGSERQFSPTYADIRLDHEGCVEWARLERAPLALTEI
jgi:UDP-2,3-diacylglucosamine pyrophosphatase LpxH